ncbi:probable glutamate receptor [Daphnia carinata]|uniref:probable glutamate receptor n=1 Tax=Daphnia carinata TaxID=120202 RepID=UPI00258039D0|nr:probable glutamate receptor [Daphnia carinata]
MRTVLWIGLVIMSVVPCSCRKINNHLRIASFFNPLANISGVSVNKIGMIEYYLLDILSQYLNFTYEIYVPPDVPQLGSPDETKGNGSWTGVLGQLVRDEVDMSISFGPSFHSRHLVVDVSVPIILDDISIVVPYPQQDTNAAAYLYAFDLATWITMILSFSTGCLAIWIVALVQKKGERDLPTILMFIIAVSLGQGGYLRQYSQYSSPSRLIQGSVLLALLVVSYSFCGIVTSMITSPRYEFVVRSIEDVVEKENIQPLIIKESSTQAEFEDSSYPIFQKVYNRINNNPMLLIPSSSEFVDVLLSNPNNVIIMSNLLADSEIQKDFKRHRVCRATILPKIVNDRTNCLFLQKDSPYTAAIDRLLLLLRQAGLSDYLDNSYDTFASRCYINERKLRSSKRDRSTSPLTLYDLRGIFRTFAYLFLCCFVAFICELIVGKCQFPCWSV